MHITQRYQASSSTLEGWKLNQQQLPSQNHHDTLGASYHARWGYSSHHSLPPEPAGLLCGWVCRPWSVWAPTPRSPTQREKSVPQLRSREDGAGLGASGQPSSCRPVGPERRFFQTLGKVEWGTNSSELTGLLGSVPRKVPGDTPPPKPCWRFHGPQKFWKPSSLKGLMSYTCPQRWGRTNSLDPC